MEKVKGFVVEKRGIIVKGLIILGGLAVGATLLRGGEEDYDAVAEELETVVENMEETEGE